LLAEAEKLIAGRGVPCLAEALDITDEHAVRGWVDRATARLGTPDVLINNASVLGERTELLEYPLRSWRRTIEVNLTGTLVVTRAVLPGMVERRSGSVVMVSSGAARPPRERWGAYAVSKSAVETLTLNLAAELRESGVRLNIVDPGAMRTGMRAAAYPGEDPDQLKEPALIAPLFLWLAGDQSREVTGTRIVAEKWMAEQAGR
jgi:NAD(P)-dependent dehydrogenase (short-subunit alcohol dehydrogenase family)